MGGLMDALTASANGLQTQQFGAVITGNNINNVGMPGYHSENVIFASGGYGNSAPQTATAKRAIDQNLETQLNAQFASSSFADTRAGTLAALQNVATDMTPTGLGAALGNFFAGWRNISANPNDLPTRSDMLARMGNLANRFNTMAHGLGQQQQQVDGQIVAQVNHANTNITAVAALNAQILTAEASGQEASSLRDQRDYAVNQLAQQLGASATFDSVGNINVQLGNGISVVSGVTAHLLGVSPNAATGLHDVQVVGTTEGAINNRLSGSIGALLTVRDQDIVATQNNLDQLAADFSTAANSAHAALFGLDGVSGRNLFTPHALAGAAGAIAVDASVAGKPSALGAASTAAGVPGDNAGAQSMIALESQNVALSNTQTLGQSLSLFVATVGQTVATANSQQMQQDAQLLASQALHESATGVSIEQQMLQLSKFQQSYQAATRLVSVIDTMMQSLLSM